MLCIIYNTIYIYNILSMCIIYICMYSYVCVCVCVCVCVYVQCACVYVLILYVYYWFSLFLFKGCCVIQIVGHYGIYPYAAPLQVFTGF